MPQSYSWREPVFYAIGENKDGPHQGIVGTPVRRKPPRKPSTRDLAKAMADNRKREAGSVNATRQRNR